MYGDREFRTRRSGALSRITRLLLATGLTAAPAIAVAQEAPPPGAYDQASFGETDGRYGYVRMLDGTATLIQPGGERIQVQVNEPVLVGDRVFISGDSKAEVLLADGNILRLGAGADVGFTALAGSPDSSDPTTVLDLRRGTIQVVAVAGQLGQAFPVVTTPNSSFNAREPGSYLIVVDNDEYTEVVVRQGRAEVFSGDDGADVRPGEALFVDGRGNARLEFASAPSTDRLEAWGDGLSDYETGDYATYVDQDLRYSAATLRGHGTWVNVGASVVWRPYVSVGWAPYRNGRWRWTPGGWFWVSYEPWGWVPHHYGYWDYHGSWGWVWYPGRRFASAHVYFVWGSGGYAGWCPTGYYWSHYGGYYGNRYGGYRGVYGWVNGSGWYSKNRYWTFLPTDRLGDRRQHIYALSGEQFGRSGRSLGRGLLTTDTRELRPDVWRRPNDGITRLARSAGRELDDATPFVNRVERLPSSLERVTLRDRGEASGVSGRSATADAGRQNAGGALRSRAATDANRANIDAGVRNPTGRSVLGGARAGAATDARAASGRSDEAGRTLRRPETSRPTSTSARAPGADRARPDARSTSGDRQLRRPETLDRTPSRDALRRPSSSVDRSSARGTSRPSVRSSPSSGRARPTVRGGESVERTRPTVRSSGSSRPTVRSGGSARPTVRSSGSSRPTVRSSGSSRPTVRSGGSARPTVRSSGSSRPTVRSSGSSRPTVRSGGSARPTVRSGGSPSRSSGVLTLVGSFPKFRRLPLIGSLAELRSVPLVGSFPELRRLALVRVLAERSRASRSQPVTPRRGLDGDGRTAAQPSGHTSGSRTMSPSGSIPRASAIRA